MQQPPIYLDINNNKSIITALKAGEEYVFDAVYSGTISVDYVLFVRNMSANKRRLRRLYRTQ